MVMQQIKWLNFQDLLSGLEGMDDLGLCLLDQQGTILSLNATAAMILNADQLSGRCFSDLFPDQEAETLLKGHQAFLERGSLHPLQEISLDFRVTLLRNELETGQGVLLILQEQQTERVANDYWSKVALRSLDEAIVITDSEGVVQYLNEGAERLTKVSKERAVGEPIQRIMMLLDSETELSTTIPLEKVLQGSQFTSGATHLLLDHQGNKRPISEFITPWRDSLGNIKGVVIAFRERRRTVEPPMQGAIEDFEDALTLLQTIIGVKRDGALTLVNEISDYTFYLRHGKLVHFAHQEFDDITALIQVYKLRHGLFTFDPSIRPERQTRSDDLMSLIIDVARQMDEVKKTKFESLSGKV
jgi:PAS domain S-box-containing protein